MESLGERIAISQLRANCSNIKLAKLIGVHPNTIVTWKKNTKEPGVNKVKLMAFYLNVDLVWLITGSEAGKFAYDELADKISRKIAEAGPEYRTEETINIINDFLKLNAEHRKAVADLIAAYIIKEGK